MARPPRVTHAYSYDDGWVRIRSQSLTPAAATGLRDEGFTMVRVRQGWQERELSLPQYLARHGAASDAGPRRSRRATGSPTPAD